jgi:hypothetical protein
MKITKDNIKQFRRERIAFLDGVIEGITLYAVWSNGEQLVGCLRAPLQQVLLPYVEEKTRIIKELSIDEALLTKV